MGTEVTIAALAADPSPLRRTLTAGGQAVVVRALDAGDTAALARFLRGLSATSRRFWHGDTDDDGYAAELVGAIGRYDKLRLVARATEIIALVDLSFCLPGGYEIDRFARHGVVLDEDRTVRFGPCVADAWQGTGLAAALLAPAWAAARLLGRDTAVLYGGVHAGNGRARAFYRKAGFAECGRFTDGLGVDCVDMVLDLPPSP